MQFNIQFGDWEYSGIGLDFTSFVPDKAFDITSYFLCSIGLGFDGETAIPRTACYQRAPYRRFALRQFATELPVDFCFTARIDEQLFDSNGALFRIFEIKKLMQPIDKLLNWRGYNF